ncbi:MAG: multifunctional CCA addition/repair protein [Gammaproteobacteria bacterium]|nr:MAG: multifunctional CCA addition/repair protein [Gammaproteobacteria bacterium]RKZ95583.1 MAG: multifunctional CCA addition/repair protein [Gammaproteobacteria bacterium]RKZ97972.1 MAG: multifunctional CCA addition/repair protein [Gammaproteobacteria bacterium]RLA01980.1 MAG: multifunctional CCA addition/repair protein [Gammaproteobacteria bacterium]
METYLVGGSVRDQLLGLPIKDRDWVVVGSSPKDMIDKGFQTVGKDFPVFLHPKTHEEYALARTERKIGPGYHGFVVHASPDVSLEQDLARRDLTINAIAQAEDGTLIDPFNGQQDLQDKVLRHVSPAFTEDPVRVLRIARFAARFGFTIADETKQLIQQMVVAKELDYLVPERVWQELEKALATAKPSLFFFALRDSGALASIFPEVDRLFGVPQSPKWHPEIDTGIHVMMVIDQAARLTEDITVRFAALCHDLGKGTTPKDILPRHIGHEARSIDLTKNLCRRLRVPKEAESLALKVAEYHTHMHLLFEMKPATILKVIEALDAFRRPKRFEQYLLACEADFRGRPGYEDEAMPELELFKRCFSTVQAIQVQPLIEQGLQGKEIADELRKQRIDTIAQLRENADYS